MLRYIVAIESLESLRERQNHRKFHQFTIVINFEIRRECCPQNHSKFHRDSGEQSQECILREKRFMVAIVMDPWI
jgi:hypothetical protein